MIEPYILFLCVITKSVEEREHRLRKERERKARPRSNESIEDRTARLTQIRIHKAEMRGLESIIESIKQREQSDYAQTENVRLDQDQMNLLKKCVQKIMTKYETL